MVAGNGAEYISSLWIKKNGFSEHPGKTVHATGVRHAGDGCPQKQAIAGNTYKVIKYYNNANHVEHSTEQ